MSDYFPQAVDYVVRYGKLVLQRLRRPRNLGYLAAFTAELQALEAVAFGVMEAFSLDSAAGAQLDAIGRILHVVRGPHTDDQYRLYLRAEIRVLKSHGTPDDLISIVLAVFPRMVARYEQVRPATVDMHLERVAADDDRAALLTFLKRGKAGGVRILLEYVTSATRAFTFSDIEIEDDSDSQLGFGDDIDPSPGGLFSDVEE